jgi:hypothetical protein
MLRTKSQTGDSHPLDSMPLARRERGEKKRRTARVMCCVLVNVWTLITLYKDLEPLEDVQVCSAAMVAAGVKCKSTRTAQHVVL